MPVVKGNLSSAGYTTFWAARNRSDACGSPRLLTRPYEKGLEELKDGSEYDSLYAAADSRAKADWLVGMNASRALAIVSGSSNNSIGRVQTPTLAMICSRYRENRSFVSTPYWQLHLSRHQ
jgi:DNA topoisomerase IA